MRFWDSSALVPLIVEEPSTAALEALVEDDPEIAAWWATPVECASAISRRARMLATDEGRGAGACRHLHEFALAWAQIPPTNHLRDVAIRLVRVHDLRAGDALQLAAALAAAENRPNTLELVTLDDRLAGAARREGFSVLP